MEEDEESAEYVQELCDNLLACSTLEQLDKTVELSAIERALRRPPHRPTETVCVYVMFTERIKDSLDYLPEDAITLDAVERAMTRLAFVYLLRIGFIRDVEFKEAGLRWTMNPFHPIDKTMASLERSSPGIFRAARTASRHPAGLKGLASLS